ncbi:hypothetical protein Tco_0607699 [Tanacetum coccineum]
MPPRRFKKKSVKRIVEKRVAKAIEEYEKIRVDSNNTGGFGSVNTGGTVALTCKIVAEDDSKRLLVPLSRVVALTWLWNGKYESNGRKQELWTLTLKGDKHEAYTITSYELPPAKGRGQRLDGKTYHGAIGARHIISQVRVLLGVVNVTSLVTRKGSVDLVPVAGWQNSLQNVTCSLVVGNHGTTEWLVARRLKKLKLRKPS